MAPGGRCCRIGQPLLACYAWLNYCHAWLDYCYVTMVDVRVLLENKKKLVSQCIAAGLLGEIINLIYFLNTHVWREDDKDEAEEDVDAGEESEEEVTESPFNDFEEEIESLQYDTRVYLFLIVAFGIVAVVAFLLFLLECCKQNEILDGVLSQKESWKREAEELKRKVDEVKNQVVTLKVDVLEDLEANLFGNRGDKKIGTSNDDNNNNNNNNDESQERRSELVLTPKQVNILSYEIKRK